MKKIYYLATVAAALLVAASCAKEIDNNTDEKPIVASEKSVSLSGNVGPETKVSTDNAGTFKWQASDKITILTNNGNNREFTAASAGLTSDFSGHIPEADDLDGGLALYPASEDHFTDGSDYLFNLNDKITWSADASMMPMISKISIVDSKPQATFKAVGGVMKLVCYNIPAGATELWFTADGKNIVGSFEVDPDAATPTITSDAGSDDTVIIDFTGNYSASKVFYIPLPVVTLNGFTITITDGSAELFSVTTTAKPSISRNKLLIAPSLNCGVLADATLTNSEIVDKDWGTSYKSESITNSYGTWSFNAALQGNYGGDGKYYMQLTSGRDPVSYLQLPNFSKNIASITFHSVCNTSNAKYTGSIYFASSSSEPVSPIATAPAATKAKEDITLNISSGEYKTGYIKVSSACRIGGFTISFVSDSYSSPTITPSDDNINIAVADGTTNSASTSITYSALTGDNLGISIASHSDWITPTLTGSGSSWMLSVSASKYTESASDRPSGTVVLRGTGVSKTITVNQPSALVPNPVVSVLPGNGTFTAIWTKHAHAIGYTIYLGNPEDGGTDISSDPGISLSDGTYTLTKTVANASYSLYVKPIVEEYYVGQDGYTKEDFTCSAAAYTVTITQPSNGGSFTANDNSESFYATAGETITLVASDPSTGYKWGGWSVSNNVTDLSNSSAKTATFTMPAGDVTVTASFPAKTWTKVIDDTSFAVGDIIIITNASATKAAGPQSGNNMPEKSVTPNTGLATLSSIGDAQQITLGKSGTYWTMSVGEDTYLAATGGTSNNYLKTESTISDKSKWTISITNGEASIIANITGTATKDPRNVVKYNSSNNIFSCYASSSSQGAVCIYRYE